MTVRQTSRDVYREIEEEGLLSRQRWRVYKTVFHHGPMTVSEAFEHLERVEGKKINWNTRTRFTELRNAGVLREVGTRPCNVTGRNVIVWDVTDSLPQEEQKQLTAKELKKMAKVTLNIEGEPNELITVLEALGGTGAVVTAPKAEKVVAKPAPKAEAKEEKAPAKPKAKPAASKKANGAASKKAAAAPKPEPAEEEEPEEVEEEDFDTGEEEEEAAEPAENNSEFSVDPSHPALQDARRLREVVQHIVEQGFEDKEEVITVCEEIRDEVPLLQRVQKIPDRVGKAFDLLAG